MLYAKPILRYGIFLKKKAIAFYRFWQNSAISLGFRAVYYMKHWIETAFSTKNEYRTNFVRLVVLEIWDMRYGSKRDLNRLKTFLNCNLRWSLQIWTICVELNKFHHSTFNEVWFVKFAPKLTTFDMKICEVNPWNYPSPEVTPKIGKNWNLNNTWLKGSKTSENCIIYWYCWMVMTLNNLTYHKNPFIYGFH